MNILFPVPAGQNGYTPNMRCLDATAETLDTVISPGFVNKIMSSGNPLNPNDMLLVSYANGVEFFYQSINNEGVISLLPANQTVPFPFTNVQFVAAGGSDLNAGNNLNAPKATVAAALSAVSAGGLVWVLDAQTFENQPITFNKMVTLYAPNCIFVQDSVSGSLFTQVDTGGSYLVYVVAQTLEAAGGANVITQNGALSGLLVYASETIGPINASGSLLLTSSLYSGALTFTATAQAFFDVIDVPSYTLSAAIGSRLNGKFGNTHFGTQTFIDQVISQQVETQETVGRTVTADDSNTTINYMSASTGAYVFPNTGIPVGTVITFTQLSSGAVQFNSDGTSTILSYINATPVRTNGLNSVGTAEQIAAGVWMISGNLVMGIGP
jgi:hypothetical protein